MSEKDPSDGRGGSRDSMLLLTLLRDVSGNALGNAIIRNISSNGMLAEGDFRLKPEQIVRFDLRNIGELSGEVVRIEPNQIAIRFHREIDPMKVRRPVGGGRH